MYIPEFVCGIVATILVEILASVIYSFWIKDEKK